MGACCGCLNGAEQPTSNNYEPIKNQREAPVVQTKSSTKVSTINYYQTIVDDATNNFLNSKPISVTSNPINSEEVELVRSKFVNSSVNPVVLASPPSSSTLRSVPGGSVRSTLEERHVSSYSSSSSKSRGTSVVDQLGSIVVTRQSTTERKGSALVSFSSTESPAASSASSEGK